MTRNRRQSEHYGVAVQKAGDTANIVVWHKKEQETQQTLWCGITKSRRNNRHYGAA